MARIALVQPPHSFDGSFNCLPTFQIGIGMLSLKAFLQQHGHTVKVFHIPWALLEGVSAAEVFGKIVGFEPDLVGVALNWLHFSDGALETCQEIKRRLPGVAVVLGGQHASIFRDEIARQAGHLFDLLLAGEAELGILQAVERVVNHEPLDSTISGAVRLLPDGTLEVSPTQVIENLDDLPFFFADDIWPDYPTHFLGAPDSVKGYLLGFKPRAALDTVRGVCPKECSYCIASRIGAIQGRNGLVAHSIDWIVEHIEQLVARGLSAITIQDPFFILGDAGLIALSEGILARNLHKKLSNFDIFVEPGDYSPEAMALFARTARAVVIEFGVETGSKTVARAMGRQTDYGLILDNMLAARRAGLIPLSWWMVGLPDEGAAEIAETKEFIATSMAQGIIPAQVSPMVLFPQTRLAETAQRWGITQTFTTFSDFSRFSREPVNDEGVYPNLVTHHSVKQSANETIRYVKEVRDQFLRSWPDLAAVYKDTPLSGFLERSKDLMKYRLY